MSEPSFVGPSRKLLQCHVPGDSCRSIRLHVNCRPRRYTKGREEFEHECLCVANRSVEPTISMEEFAGNWEPRRR